jgi:predicted aspartyl protease
VRVSFDRRQGLVILGARLWGPTGNAVLRLALDTGATSTIIDVGLLLAVGYDPTAGQERVQITTGSGIEFAPRVITNKISALGQERLRLPILGHTLPPTAGLDGLLGLDFFRQRRLTLDFRRGQIVLN